MILPKAISGCGSAQLADGRCLIFGGNDQTDFVYTVSNDTYLFAADGLSFTQVGDVPVSLGSNAVSAVLGDGRVLVVDGTIAITFDPGTLMWTTQANPAIFMSDGAMVSLPNGNALLIQGNNNTGVQEYVYSSDSWVTRASTQVPQQYTSAIVLPNGDVFIDSFSGTVEIYNYGSDTWSFPATQPQAENHCQALAVLPNGRLFTSTSAGSGIVSDLFDPDTKTFSPLPLYTGASHSLSIFPNPYCYLLGENLIVILDAFIPRPLWFNVGTRVWSGGGQDADPNLTYNGETFEQGVSFYLGQPGATLRFLRAGFTMQSEGLQIPHFAGRYYELSSEPINDGRVPTFGGVLSVVQGTAPDRVFLTWAAGSDTKTDFRDLNYYVCAAQTPGGEDFNSPLRTTEIWAGSLSRELTDLTVGVTYYFKVRAKNMVGKNQPGNQETNDVELTLVPGPVAPPTFAWVSTVDLDQPRMGLVGATQADGRYHVWGGFGFGGQTPFGGVLFSQTGLALVPDPNAASITDGATVNDTPEILFFMGPGTNDSHRVAAIGGNDCFSVTTACAEYYPYTGNWFNGNFLIDGGNNIGPLAVAVANHAVAILPFGDILCTGGRTTLGDPFSTVNTVQRLSFAGWIMGYFTRTAPFTVGAIVRGLTSGALAKIVSDQFTVFLNYDGQTGNFTVGEHITGQTSGATATILFNIDFGAFGSLYIDTVVGTFLNGEEIIGDVIGDAFLSTDPGNFGTLGLVFSSELNFEGGEVLLDASGGSALGSGSPSINGWNESWTSVAPMNLGRSLHEAVALNGVLICYTTQTGAFSIGEFITGQVSGATATVTADTNNGGDFGILDLKAITGTFQLGEQIIGSGTGNAYINRYKVYRTDKVLVVGGKDTTDSPILSAEVYDGTTNTWSSLIPTAAAHYQFKMVTMIGDFNRLVLAISGGSAVTEIFYPDTNTFASTAPMPVGQRTEFTAHVFGDGKVGVFGGRTDGFLNTDVLTDTWGTSKDDVWVVGFEAADTAGVIYHWDGASWARATFVLGPVTRFFSVYGFATNDVWVVGQSGYAMHFDGATWTDVSIPSGFTLFCVFGVAGAEVWAIGLAGRIYLWNGSAFVAQTSPTSEDLRDMEGVHVGETINYIAVGRNGTIIQYSDTVPTWTIIQPTLAPGIDLLSIARFTSPTFAMWICGDNGSTYRSTGGAFSAFSNGMPSDIFWQKVRGTASNDVWMIGTSLSGDLGAVAHFDGSSWTLTHTGFGNTTFRGLMAFPVSGPPNRFVWAVGNQQDMFFNQPAVVFNYDGSSWVADYIGGEPAGVVPTVLLYDPDANVWFVKPSMINARARHVSFLMPNNKVLVAGGEDPGGNPLSAAEISS